MIAVQKPPALFASPAFRPMHSRHPSAPVVVRPSHTPGVLNLAKPPAHPSPRPQHTQAQPRAPRASPKARQQQQRSPQPVPAQAAAAVEKTKTPAPSPAKADQPPTTADQSPRGRKQRKHPKESAGRRGASASPSDVATRRPAHQPSPPPARIPSPQKAAPAPRAQVARAKPEDSTSDPFFDDVGVVPQDRKADGKTRSPPKLASQPSGKLARRRQASVQLVDSPTPKGPARRKHGRPTLEESAAPLQPAFALRSRPGPRRASTDLTSTRWDSFPVCDDSSECGDDSDLTPPTTPIREAASVPPKGQKGTWQQETFLLEDAPRTAPLASTFGFPFVGHSPCSTPTPAQRRRNHRRVPSEGVFGMSTDEESPSSSVTDLFESMQLKRRSPVNIPRQRCLTTPAGASPSSFGASVADRLTSSSAPSLAAGYFAGSVFQNSPSPDDLPAPSFVV